jgi:hypothetical protein
MKLLAAFILAFLAIAAPATAADKPQLDLAEFFAGRTHGEGTMKKALHRPSRMTIDTVGRRGKGGEFILVDTIKEAGEPTKTRRWVMRPTANGFTGTISDAVGPVHVEVSGTKATIRYKMKGGISVHQVLTMRDGKTLSNQVTGRKLGVRVARMEGTIRKLD